MNKAVLPVNRRPYRAFLSHAHADKAVVDALYRWLAEASGLPIWYDAVHLPVGSQIGTELPEAVAAAGALILILSRSSLQSGWVKREYNAAIAQATSLRSYRILPIRIDDCEPPDAIDIERWITLRDGRLTVETALEILRGLYPFGRSHLIPTEFDTYLSRGWRPSELATADWVSQQLHRRGIRLIGDVPDQQTWDEERVRSIIRGCGGLVAIVPDRGSGSTSKYILREIGIALAEGLPVLSVVAPAVLMPEQLQGEGHRILRLEGDGNGSDARDTLGKELAEAIQDFQESWGTPARASGAAARRGPPQPNVVFLGRSLGRETMAVSEVLREVIERTTALECVVGDQLRDNAQEEIVSRIKTCRFAIIDVTDDKLNTCIEAGIALGAGVELYLIAGGPRRTPAFMFRHKNVFDYHDDVELIGLVHKLALPHRRRVINIELME